MQRTTQHCVDGTLHRARQVLPRARRRGGDEGGGETIHAPEGTELSKRAITKRISLAEKTGKNTTAKPKKGLGPDRVGELAADGFPQETPFVASGSLSCARS